MTGTQRLQQLADKFWPESLNYAWLGYAPVRTIHKGWGYWMKRDGKFYDLGGNYTDARFELEGLKKMEKANEETI